MRIPISFKSSPKSTRRVAVIGRNKPPKNLDLVPGDDSIFGVSLLRRRSKRDKSNTSDERPPSPTRARGLAGLEASLSPPILPILELPNEEIDEPRDSGPLTIQARVSSKDLWEGAARREQMAESEKNAALRDQLEYAALCEQLKEYEEKFALVYQRKRSEKNAALRDQLEYAALCDQQKEFEEIEALGNPPEPFLENSVVVHSKTSDGDLDSLSKLMIAGFGRLFSKVKYISDDQSIAKGENQPKEIASLQKSNVENGAANINLAVIPRVIFGGLDDLCSRIDDATEDRDINISYAIAPNKNATLSEEREEPEDQVVLRNLSRQFEALENQRKDSYRNLGTIPRVIFGGVDSLFNTIDLVSGDLERKESEEDSALVIQRSASSYSGKPLLKDKTDSLGPVISTMDRISADLRNESESSPVDEENGQDLRQETNQRESFDGAASFLAHINSSIAARKEQRKQHGKTAASNKQEIVISRPKNRTKFSDMTWTDDSYTAHQRCNDCHHTLCFGDNELLKLKLWDGQ